MNELTEYKPTLPSVEFTPEQIDLIKRMIAPGATNDELSVFMHQVRRTGLDPLNRQIYAVKRWNNTLKKETVTIQTSIDGYRLVAERTGKYAGQTEANWCGDDGVWRDVWLSKSPPAAARVGVYKTGHAAPTYGIAMWEEYKQVDREGKPTAMWRKMPATMLAKCAEALALRKAFPQELSNIYTAEEMAQAENEVVKPAKTIEVVPEPAARNYTEEAEACKTLDELKAWYISLTKQEQVNLRALKDSVKDRLSKPEEPVTEATVISETPALATLINGLTAAEFTLDGDSIKPAGNAIKAENEIRKLKKASDKRTYLNLYKHKIDQLGVLYEPNITPF